MKIESCGSAVHPRLYIRTTEFFNIRMLRDQFSAISWQRGNMRVTENAQSVMNIDYRTGLEALRADDRRSSYKKVVEARYSPTSVDVDTIHFILSLFTTFFQDKIVLIVFNRNRPSVSDCQTLRAISTPLQQLVRVELFLYFQVAQFFVPFSIKLTRLHLQRFFIYRDHTSDDVNASYLQIINE